jgi:hypothetical protein
MVDFGSEQGLIDFGTGGIARLFRGFQKSENAALGPKYALFTIFLPAASSYS